jgi:hypothetical protein
MGCETEPRIGCECRRPRRRASRDHYLTAILDLALPAERNLLVSDDQGELLTTAKLPIPDS